MTDLDSMRAMLRRAEIPFEEKPSGFKHSERNPECVVLTVVGGYCDFSTSLSFRKDTGELFDIAAREG